MKLSIDRIFSGLADRVEQHSLSRRLLNEKTSPQVKVGLRQLLAQYRGLSRAGEAVPVASTGLRVFSQTDEDGIILYLLSTFEHRSGLFIDIGGGDGIHASNCANLAFNLGYHGLIIDADNASVARGRAVYERHPDTRHYPSRFVCSHVTTDSIDSLIAENGFGGEVDVMSIDIDGNDYWIWEAITSTRPKIVVAETHPEFGLQSIVVPYDPDFAWSPSAHPHYLGASPVAMAKLAGRLGYRLVGANAYGFNAVYLREDIAPALVPTVEVAETLWHPRNADRMRLFDEMKHLDFEVV